MANNRPIRRGRIPFRRGRRWTASTLKHRWIDGNSSRTSLDCAQITKDLLCDPDENPVQLLYGDADWDWADASEVRIDRIVGSICWDSEVAYPGSGTVGEPRAIEVRLGIIATEEDGGVAPVLDLFDPEVLEEHQWMWLYNSMGDRDVKLDNNGQAFYQWDNIDVDIRTRRKLGKKDSVWLYGQFHHHTNQANAAGTVTRVPILTHMLRCIIRS